MIAPSRPRDIDSPFFRLTSSSRNEIAAGVLMEGDALPGIVETFHAVTISRRFPNPLVRLLLQPPSNGRLIASAKTARPQTCDPAHPTAHRLIRAVLKSALSRTRTLTTRRHACTANETERPSRMAVPESDAARKGCHRGCQRHPIDRHSGIGLSFGPGRVAMAPPYAGGQLRDPTGRAPPSCR